MSIQNINLIKEIEFAPNARGGNAKKRHSTTLSRTPFLDPSQFQSNNPLRLPRTEIKKSTSQIRRPLI